MTFALGGGDNPPDRCFQANAQGDLPTCTYDGSWHRSYDGSGLGGGADGGIPGWFVALFVLFAVVGVGVTIYKMSVARGMATKAGLDADDAAAMTLLTDHGLEATYLAANLRRPQQPAPPVVPPDATPTVATRLRELKGLLDEGLITPDEYAARRQAILDQT